MLIAEDHPTNRTLLTRLLNVLGYATVAAENGREALQVWDAGGIAAIVTDCNMPEMDGYELARAVRAEEQGSGQGRTPIVACTANALADELTRCTAAGMDDLLAKPVELERLARVMGQWLPLPSGAAPVKITTLTASKDDMLIFVVRVRAMMSVLPSPTPGTFGYSFRTSTTTGLFLR